MNASPAQPESTTTADRNVLSPARAVELMRTGTVFVAGAGVAGRGVLTMLRALSPSSDAASDQTRRVVIVDDNPAVEGLGVAEAIAALRTDPPRLLITSPGWRPGSELLLAAAEAGVPVIGDIEAAWLADQAGAFGQPRAWLAVTGTNGKTTATAMLTAMHVADGRAAVAVGNIGTPPGVALTAESRGEARVDVLVAEASSFQLHWAPTFAPTVGCVLNLAEDHIDWHGSFEGYAGDKARVYRSSRPVLALDDAAVLNAAVETSGSSAAAWAYTLADPTEPMNFPAGTSEQASSVFRTRIECIVGVHAGRLVQVYNANPGGDFLPGEVRDLRSASGISPAGPAGVADAAAAAAMALRNGVSVGAISEALDTFSVQAHRGQVVHDFGEVQWIDNSKATNPHAAEAALLGQGERSVVWVAGGQLKGAQVTDLIAKVYPQLKAVIALGVDRGIILDAIARHAAQMGQTPPERVDVSTTDPDDAMRQVVAAAHRIAASGDKVILAPAAASLDMYTGMGQRGELFATYAIQTAVGE